VGMVPFTGFSCLFGGKELITKEAEMLLTLSATDKN